MLAGLLAIALGLQTLKPTGTSLMPDGLLDDLDDQQLRDFFAYLRIPQPITR